MKAKEYGHLAAALRKSSFKPTLSVDARVDTGMGMMPDKSYRKEELKRLRKEIKAANDQLENWDPEDISTRALKSLKRDLAVKKARLMEYEALADDDDEEGKE